MRVVRFIRFLAWLPLVVIVGALAGIIGMAYDWWYDSQVDSSPIWYTRQW